MSTAGPNARIVPLRRSVCYWCVLALVIAPALIGCGLAWVLLS